MEALTIGEEMVGLAPGSRDDFATWVAPHVPALSRYATRLVGRDDREDVVQETLIRAWRRRSTFDPRKGEPLPWLLAIAADRARNHLRRRRSTLPLAVHDHSVDNQAPDIDLELALRRLPPRQRQAVDLYYFVGLGVPDVALVMRCAQGTVRATLHQARAALRELLGEPDV